MTPIADIVAKIGPISAWRAFSSGFPAQAPPEDFHDLLPRDYLQFLDSLGAGEGFIGTSFLRLFALEDLASVNAAYRVPEYMPGRVLIGSDGCGNAFLLDVRTKPNRVVRVEFVPLDEEYASIVAPDFLSFVEALCQVPEDFAGTLPLALDPKTVGLELHEKHPVVLGGDPVATDNKVFLPLPTHAQACDFFNRLFREVRAQSGSS